MKFWWFDKKQKSYENIWFSAQTVFWLPAEESTNSSCTGSNSVRSVRNLNQWHGFKDSDLSIQGQHLHTLHLVFATWKSTFKNSCKGLENQEEEIFQTTQAQANIVLSCLEILSSDLTLWTDPKTIKESVWFDLEILS